MRTPTLHATFLALVALSGCSGPDPRIAAASSAIQSRLGLTGVTLGPVSGTVEEPVATNVTGRLPDGTEARIGRVEVRSAASVRLMDATAGATSVREADFGPTGGPGRVRGYKGRLLGMTVSAEEISWSPSPLGGIAVGYAALAGIPGLPGPVTGAAGIEPMPEGGSVAAVRAARGKGFEISGEMHLSGAAPTDIAAAAFSDQAARLSGARVVKADASVGPAPGGPPVAAIRSLTGLLGTVADPALVRALATAASGAVPAVTAVMRPASPVSLATLRDAIAMPGAARDLGISLLTPGIPLLANAPGAGPAPAGRPPAATDAAVQASTAPAGAVGR